jgi:hypothetical protein
MKHYLKQISNYGAESFQFYDSETGTSIRVDKWDIAFETIDKDDIDWDLGHDLRNHYNFITREEFESYFIERVNKLNELSKTI